MPPLHLYGLDEKELEEVLPQRRENIIRLMGRRRSFDVLIIGGGIHGAACAHLAALNGMNAALLERGDYASGTSGRSSKMAHGGLRYLELFDFMQVREGIAAREDLFRTADHLAQPQLFLLPVPAGRVWHKTKLQLGLALYDWGVGVPGRAHRWRPRGECGWRQLGGDDSALCGCFEYSDGIMNDTRLVIEHILAARQEGALCLNYAEVMSLKQRFDGTVEIGWRDRETGSWHELRAGAVMNCTGPWAPYTGRLTAGPLADEILYSRGSHLLFAAPWTGPALTLPLEERGSYYFVWPHFAGTLVGTTERIVAEPARDPLPAPDEINELLSRLARDLPGAGLTRENLHYGYAGIRTLRAGKGARRGHPSRLSRAHRWYYADGVLSLVGGKFTSAAATAYQGLRQIVQLSKAQRELVPLSGRRLPGAGLSESDRRLFLEKAHERGVPEPVARRTLGRLGRRALRLMEDENGFELLGQSALRGELLLALKEEQALTLEDIMRRRLDLEYLPGHGVEALSHICALMAQNRSAADVEKEQKEYRTRLETLQKLLRGEATA